MSTSQPSFSIQTLLTNVEICVTEEEFTKKVENRQKLMVKLGIDATTDKLHLGHYILLRKCKEFSEIGCKVVIIIGDTTASIGDPSGRTIARPELTLEEVESNAKCITDEIIKLFGDSFMIIRNSRTLEKLDLKEIVNLLSSTTINQVLERHDFKNRLTNNKPIGLQEVLYSLLQAMDSVNLRADIEIGGVDQLYNIHLARRVQKYYKQEQEVGLLMPLLIGLDGQDKMSKSKNNQINISDTPDEMFKKIMSISDVHISHYFKLVFGMNQDDTEKISSDIQKGLVHPKESKLRLSKDIVTIFYGEEIAERTKQEFINVFSNGELPTGINISTREVNPVKLYRLIFDEGLSESVADAKRLIQQNAVLVNNEIIKDISKVVGLEIGEILIQIGKNKFKRVIFEES